MGAPHDVILVLWLPWFCWPARKGLRRMRWPLDMVVLAAGSEAAT